MRNPGEQSLSYLCQISELEIRRPDGYLILVESVRTEKTMNSEYGSRVRDASGMYFPNCRRPEKGLAVRQAIRSIVRRPERLLVKSDEAIVICVPQEGEPQSRIDRLNETTPKNARRM
jgi:hypothetical protein